jgi:hypothetical protein
MSVTHLLTRVALQSPQEVEVLVQLSVRPPLLGVQLVQLLLSGAALQALWGDGEQVTQLLLGEVPGADRQCKLQV